MKGDRSRDLTGQDERTRSCTADGREIQGPGIEERGYR